MRSKIQQIVHHNTKTLQATAESQNDQLTSIGKMIKEIEEFREKELKEQMKLSDKSKTNRTHHEKRRSKSKEDYYIPNVIPSASSKGSKKSTSKKKSKKDKK